MERTVVIIKPDGVKRGLVGEIVSRFERVGLKVVALKMVEKDKEFIGRHYREDEDWMRQMGEKTLKNYKDYGLDTKKEMGTEDPLEIGKMVRVWLIDYLTSGPVVAAVLEGNHAVDNVKKIAGHTLPTYALPGTIRGDYSLDSSVLANTQKRAIKNLVHISGSTEEAKYEVSLWFDSSEIQSYERAEERVMFK